MRHSSLAVYQREDKFLLLNPILPAWIITNLTGAIAVLAFNEERSTDKVMEIISSIDSSIDVTNSLVNYVLGDFDIDLIKMKNAG